MGCLVCNFYVSVFFLLDAFVLSLMMVSIHPLPIDSIVRNDAQQISFKLFVLHSASIEILQFSFLFKSFCLFLSFPLSFFLLISSYFPLFLSLPLTSSLFLFLPLSLLLSLSPSSSFFPFSFSVFCLSRFSHKKDNLIPSQFDAILSSIEKKEETYKFLSFSCVFHSNSKIR